MEAQKVFDEGVKLLSEKKFAEARDRFLLIQKSGHSSADFQANLGQAQVESGELGPGIFSLHLAVAQDRWDSQHRRDLNFAQTKVESGWGLPMKDPAEWGQSLSTYLRPTEMASLCALFLLAFLTLRFYKKLKKGPALALLFLTLASAGGAGLAWWGRSIGIVQSHTVLKNAPLESAEQSTELKSGVRLRVIRESGDFSEVERTGAFRGWVKSDQIKRLL